MYTVPVVSEFPQVLILAGGRGTRLGGVVSDRPKCLAEVAGRPFLEYLILKLRHDGFREFVVSTGYRAEAIDDYLADRAGMWSELGVSIVGLREESPLGTGGAIGHARGLLRGERFLAANGDSLLDIDAGALLRYHEEMSAFVTLGLAVVKDASRYGTVELDESFAGESEVSRSQSLKASGCQEGCGRVKRFCEKTNRHEPGLINGGLYVMRRELLDEIPEGRSVSLEREVLPRLLEAGSLKVAASQRLNVSESHERLGVYGMVSRSYFVDIGTPEDYGRLRKNPSALIRAAGAGKYEVRSSKYEVRKQIRETGR